MKSANILPLLLLAVHTAMGGMEPGYELVPLRNGINPVDLNRDGREDTVVVAHRENFNAHSFEVTSIYLWAAQHEGARVELQVVPFELTKEERNASERERLNVQSSGGADCMLHDFRLFTRASDKSVLLVTADRAYGKNYADAQPVTFKFYQLTGNPEGSVGRPILFFKLSDTVVSKESFCDVNRAFRKELGVTRDGRSAEEPE